MNIGKTKGKTRAIKITYADGETKIVKGSHFTKQKKTKKWYLKTDHWKKVRSLVKARDNYKCVYCGDKDVRLEVHHLTYENIGREKMNELVTLCQPCHAQADRERRSDSRRSVIQSPEAPNQKEILCQS